MSPGEFGEVVTKIRPFTNYVYLHVLGEPLLHPQLDQILGIAADAGLNINITTNGGLLQRKKDILMGQGVRQINISLHDAEENIVPAQWGGYLQDALDFAQEIAPETYVCLRLWNTGSETSNDFNAFCLAGIASRFNIAPADLEQNAPGNGIKLTDHIFLQRAPRFEWPDEQRGGLQTTKNCYALRDHIAILADGQVVPCCLDADGAMPLGNIFTDDLTQILQTPRALDIKKGFEQRKVVEPLCATCGFVIG